MGLKSVAAKKLRSTFRWDITRKGGFGVCRKYGTKHKKPKPSVPPDEWCDAFTNKKQKLPPAAHLACGAEIYYISNPNFFPPEALTGFSPRWCRGGLKIHEPTQFAEVFLLVKFQNPTTPPSENMIHWSW